MNSQSFVENPWEVNFFNNFASPLDGTFVQKGENAQLADLRK